MNKLLSLTLAIIFALFMVSCESSSDPKEEDPINEAEVLLNFLEAGDANYEQWVNTLDSWIKNLGDINTDDYFVLDIRAAADYDTIHIPNAVNSTMADVFDVVDTQNTSNKPILVVCYSGQSAAYSHTLLRLKGYEAYSLKWGMSIYNAYLDKWTGRCTNDYANDAAWVTTASPALQTFSQPELNTGAETGAAILDARIDAAIAAWGSLLVSVKDGASLPSSNDYQLITYWSETDAGIPGLNPFIHYGHIDGSFQIPMKTLTAAANLGALDPDDTNLIYCWTGQTAAATIAYLQVLGYDAKSIAFGVNSLIWDELVKTTDGTGNHRWPKPW